MASFDELFALGPDSDDMSSSSAPSSSAAANHYLFQQHHHHRQSLHPSTVHYDESWLSPTASFPQKLFAMSMAEFENAYSVEWCAGGAAFRVRDPEAFSDDVLPKYFKRTAPSCSLASFL